MSVAGSRIKLGLSLTVLGVVLSGSACGKRHVSVLVDTIVRVRVVDALSGMGVDGAQVLVGFGLEDEELLNERLEGHLQNPNYGELGLSAFGVTGPSGLAVVHYRRHTSWMEGGCRRRGPGDMKVSQVWVGRDGYIARVHNVCVRATPVRGQLQARL